MAIDCLIDLFLSFHMEIHLILLLIVSEYCCNQRYSEENWYKLNGYGPYQYHYQR